jgi:3-oxoacyl-[acyl-carrier protein] reductase
MDLGLEEKVVIIGGGSRGIGLAIVETFLEEGARVAVVGREASGLAKAVKALTGRFGEDRVVGIPGDLTRDGCSQSVVAEVAQRWGMLNVVVANVGVGTDATGWDVPMEAFHDAFRTNFLASQALAQAAIPSFSKEGGSIVFTGSIAGYESLGAPAPYESAKAALHAYAKSLSRLVAELGIRVNVLAPGNILFPGGRWALRLQDEPELVQAMLDREVPLCRFGRPHEIGAAVAFLASSQAAFITGACLVVDGGQTRSL